MSIFISNLIKFFLKSLQKKYRKTKKYTSVFMIMNIANLSILKIFKKTLNRILKKIKKLDYHILIKII